MRDLSLRRLSFEVKGATVAQLVMWLMGQMTLELGFDYLQSVHMGFGAHPVLCPVGNGGSFWGLSDWGMELTNHIRLGPSLRRLGAVPPLSHTLSCHNA